MTRAITLIALMAASAARAEGPRVYLLVDMEGVAGVVSREQVQPGGMEYGMFRHLLTAEVNAAIDGALAAGAGKITVSDFHGNNMSILPDELNAKARLIRGAPRPNGNPLAGIDEGYDALFLIGMHASSHVERAVMVHAVSTGRFYDLRLNGKHTSEAILSAAMAGHSGVPLALVTGDDATVDEVHKTLGAEIVGVTVKRGLAFNAADSVAPQVARELIKDGAGRALAKLKSLRPYKLPKGPLTVEIDITRALDAENLAIMPIPTLERVNGHTLRYTGRDIIEVHRFLWCAATFGFE
jgi:D-amino peptidase